MFDSNHKSNEILEESLKQRYDEKNINYTSNHNSNEKNIFAFVINKLNSQKDNETNNDVELSNKRSVDNIGFLLNNNNNTNNSNNNNNLIVDKNSNLEQNVRERKNSSTRSFNIRKMSTWATTNGFKEDLMGFQNVEKQKTITRTNLKLYATLLFTGVVLTTSLAIIDTQISSSLQDQKRFYAQSIHNLSMYNISKQVLKKEKDKIELYKSIEISTKTLISIISVVTVIILYLYYQNLLLVKIIRNFYPANMAFIRATPLVKKLAIECCLCILHVPPYVGDYLGLPPSMNIVVFLRLYLLGRYLKEKHELMNSQSTRFLASVTKTELTSMFLFKTFFMQYPFQLILLAYFIILFIGGYGVWLIENSDYTYLDTVWMLIITMTTVGFGDLTPKTMLGRFTVGLAAIIGIFLMALFISLVNEALMLQRREKRILSYVENQDLTRQKKMSAANAIIKWFRYHKFVNKHLKCTNAQTHYLMEPQKSKGKPDVVTVVRAKLLESRMIKSINYWRKVKEVQPGGYFAQEFMIEDMKIIMNDLNERTENLEDKIENIAENLSKLVQRKESSKEPHKVIYSNLHIEKPTYKCKEKNIFSTEPSHGYDGYAFIENPWLSEENRPGTNLNNENRHKENIYNNNGKLKCKPLDIINKCNGKNDLRLAYKLLENQAKIMNNSLDDIYSKTRQDICDLENLIKSLLICSEKEGTPDRHHSNEEQKDLRV